MQGAVQRFACTQCGKCCNRSPEVELSEAAALADVFVFRLMFRLYWLPNQESDLRSSPELPPMPSSAFFERKRLLSAFAARKYPVKLRHQGKRIAYTKYLVLSALALDTSAGACSALKDRQCGIYDRRPLSCRSVPLHYSRGEALAGADLEAFVATAGYECDTSETAPVVLNEGRIVDGGINAARSKALAIAARDRRWSEAIVRRMNAATSSGGSLPTIEEIEANAQLGAMTTSMRVAWQIAADAGLITADECERLVDLQLGTIRRELGRACSRDAIDTLTAMEREYRHHLSAAQAIAVNG